MRDEIRKQLAILNQYEPALPSGEYEAKAEQTADFLGDLGTFHQIFYVEGPRFELQPEEVAGVYPPDEMKGGYDDVLPHVVLTRRTLPWERMVDRIQTNGSEPAPWLGLLLFSEDRIPKVHTGKVKEALLPAKGVFVPKLTVRESEKEAQCSWIEVAREQFMRAAPRTEELSFLCHVRRISESEDDWRAVVCGKGLPKSGADGIENRAFLVSFEGLGDYETDESFAASGSVRVFVLKTWRFYSIIQPYSFMDKAKELDTGPLVPERDWETEAETPMDDLLQNGFYPLQHQLRNGGNTVSFYRGPCVPMELEEQKDTAMNADRLLRYDPKYGVFDVSYACAWQLGRILALHRTTVAQEIINMRLQNQKKMHQGMVREIMKQEFAAAKGGGASGIDSDAGSIGNNNPESDMSRRMLDILKYKWCD